MSVYKYLKAKVFVLSLLMVIASSQIANAGQVNSSVATNEWRLANLEGQQVTLSDFKGKPVILVFWATWCPYCKKLLPAMQQLHEDYSAKGLKVLGVNIKEDWKPEVYWRNHEYQFDTVLEGDDVAQQYGIKGTPGIVFIAPSGEVLKVAHFSDPKHPSLVKFARHFTQ